jgi:hypothetical protein
MIIQDPKLVEEGYITQEARDRYIGNALVMPNEEAYVSFFNKFCPSSDIGPREDFVKAEVVE